MGPVRISHHSRRGKRCCLCVFLLSAPLFDGGRLGAQSPEVLLQKGLYEEAVRCDPRAAIAVYRDVLALESASRTIAARAHLRLGICHRLLGESEPAAEHFQIVEEGFASETEAAKLAHRYNEQAEREVAARFMPPDAFLFVEVIHAAKQVTGLAEIIRGTPFQNPVDHALFASREPSDGSSPVTTTEPTAQNAATPSPARGAAVAGPPRGWVKNAAAWLNTGFLSELSKVKALAFGVPAGADPASNHLAVLVPGDSDVLRGLIQGLTSTYLSPTRTLGEFRIYSTTWRFGEVHVAFGGDVILWGRPRKTVEQAVERYVTGGPSLATNPRFRRAQAVRPGTFLFAYASGAWVDALRGTRPRKERELFDRVSEISGLEATRPLAMTFATTAGEDTLRVAFHAWRDERALAVLWECLQTPTLGQASPLPLPADTLASLTLRTDPAGTRLECLFHEASRILQHLAPGQAGNLPATLDELRSHLLAEPARSFCESLRRVAVGVLPADEFPSLASLYLVLELRDADRGEEALRQVMVHGLHSLLKSRASREFHPGRLELSGESVPYHYVEPFPGTQLAYARRQDLFVVAFDPRVLARLLSGSGEPSNHPDASKVLSLRPRALLDASKARPGDPLMQLFRQIERLDLESVETPAHVRLELRIPRLTSTLRGVLNTIAGWRDDPPREK
ncbi:MAG: hypothetical protein O7J95_19655 [Planctomycetota bacterium]|nr:hypothetical protein [Planctomycetota bacterium]